MCILSMYRCTRYKSMWARNAFAAPIEGQPLIYILYTYYIHIMYILYTYYIHYIHIVYITYIYYIIYKYDIHLIYI